MGPISDPNGQTSCIFVFLVMGSCLGPAR